MTDLPDTDAPTVVRLSAPEDLVAALPSLLGFVPTRSLVAIAMLTREGRTRLGGMARIDLPGPGEDPGEYADAVVARLAASDPSWVQLVVITDPGADGPLERVPRDRAPDDGGVEGDPSSPPEADLVGTFRAGFAAAAIETPAPLWAARIAAGAPWRCYDECACAGTLPDPTASPAAAAHAVLTSRVVYRSRAEAEAALAPDPDAGSARRRELIEDASWDALTERSSDAAAAARAGLDTVRAAIAGAGRGTPLEEAVLEEAVLARVAVALGDPAVRDVCLGFAAGRDPGVDPEHATRLWWQLTRALPAPEVAQPATLLAFASLRRGGGVTLAVALERAIRADPDHQLSRLLDRIVSAGIGPEQIEALVLSAAAEAEERNRAQ